MGLTPSLAMLVPLHRRWRGGRGGPHPLSRYARPPPWNREGGAVGPVGSSSLPRMGSGRGGRDGDEGGLQDADPVGELKDGERRGPYAF